MVEPVLVFRSAIERDNVTRFVLILARADLRFPPPRMKMLLLAQWTSEETRCQAAEAGLVGDLQRLPPVSS